MNKSMYSIMLMDNLVKAVDSLAYQQGTSRSGMINHILAQYLSVLTPEMHIAQIFEHAANIAAQERIQLLPPTASMMVGRTVLQYKYNPTLRYSVELFVNGATCSGEFKAQSRSQSKPLLEHLQNFFTLWGGAEQACLAEVQPEAKLSYSYGGGRYQREFESAQIATCDGRTLGSAIGHYIRAFDTAMDSYFSHAAGNISQRQMQGQILSSYREYLNNTQIIL